MIHLACLCFLCFEKYNFCNMDLDIESTNKFDIPKQIWTIVVNMCTYNFILYYPISKQHPFEIFHVQFLENNPSYITFTTHNIVRLFNVEIDDIFVFVVTQWRHINKKIKKKKITFETTDELSMASNVL